MFLFYIFNPLFHKTKDTIYRLLITYHVLSNTPGLEELLTTLGSPKEGSGGWYSDRDT